MSRFILAAVLTLFISPVLAADIVVDDVRLRLPVLAGGNGALFLVLTNGGPADRLVGATVPLARSTELHTHQRDGDVVRMRRIDAIAVPDHGRAELKPGGDHLMLFGLTDRPKPGSKVPLTLTFERAGTISVEATVVGATEPVEGTGSGSDADHHAGSGHGGH